MVELPIYILRCWCQTCLQILYNRLYCFVSVSVVYVVGYYPELDNENDSNSESFGKPQTCWLCRPPV